MLKLLFSSQSDDFSLADFLLTNPTVPLVIIGTIVAGLSFRSQRHLTRSKHTLDFDKDFKDKEQKDLPAVKALLDRLTEHDLIEMGQRPMLDDKDVTLLIRALNVWESVGIGLKHHVYMEDLLYEAYGSTVRYLYRRTLPFVNERKKKNPKYFEHFHRLAIRWESRPDRR